MKNDKLAEVLRDEGNKCYADKLFFEALLKYNESLCNAESENVALAYANRSAVFFEMKLYDRSLKNIALARMHGYPSKSIEVLEKRELRCRELIESKIEINDPWKFFKLSHKPNDRLPFAADCLELRVNEKYGKHIVTSRSIKVGEMLVIEKPFCNVLISESRFIKVEASNKFQRCTNCLKSEALDLIPCETCSDGNQILQFTSNLKLISIPFQRCFARSNVAMKH